MQLKSPYVHFGGKSAVTPVIWKAFGNPVNFVDPFFGSGAVLLGRPGYDATLHTETVNDLDAMITNCFRALQADPEGVAKYADHYVNELDLHARHTWLLNQSEAIERLRSDPDYYDAKIAGWWVWGKCAWIGSGWCEAPDNSMPNLKDGGLGVHRKRGNLKIPHIANAGRGIHRKSESDIYAYFEALQQRLRRVRVCCGDWSRVVTPAVTFGHGTTAIILDPPYDRSIRDGSLYAHESDVASDVTKWAVENGDNPLLRIALCGYCNEREMPSNWVQYRWSANGGYGLQGNGRGRENRDKETIWFSPHCLPVEPKYEQPTLFAV